MTGSGRAVGEDLVGEDLVDDDVAVDVAIVGSGFAGSILARCLRARGLRVILLERDRHPRFALGESTTPLANLALERLAVAYGLEDLWELAAHGRWLESFPQLRRGLKRGFTFYRHLAGQGFDPRGGRLLVAASPEDAVADTHWLRADVDRHLAERARAEGVLLREGVDVALEALDAQGATLLLRSRERPDEQGRQGARVRARFVVDASGGGGFLARALSLAAAPSPMRFTSRLLFSHFAELPPFAEVEPAARGETDPYPGDWAAVHHVLDVGWMYQLRFDDGTVSAGLLVDPTRAGALGLEVPWDRPAQAWARLVARYPSLERQLSPARPLRPIEATPGPIQRRLSRATGPCWALLPQAFAAFDPLFSTGIAWSLLAVERLADVLVEPGLASARLGLDAYESRLQREADQHERLLTLAYRSLDDFDRFTETALLYFALVSFEETRQRLLSPAAESACRVAGLSPAWAWDGFLAALDPGGVALLEQALDQSSSAAVEAYRTWVRAAISERNVAGLGDASRHPLYPADAECVVAAAARLGLDATEARRLLPKLWSPRHPPASVARH